MLLILLASSLKLLVMVDTICTQKSILCDFLKSNFMNVRLRKSIKAKLKLTFYTPE